MTQFLKQNKMLAFGGLVVLLGALVYFMFFAGPGEAPALVQSTTNNVSRDLVVTLSNLSTIRLDDSIFTDPVFLSLSDFGVQIPLQNVGRRNPFAPF